MNSAVERVLPGRAEMERAFLESDPSYDGIFYTAVKTTGIFCLPSCSAKKALPQNIEFYGTVKQALFAGYRPCLRCRPLDLEGSEPDWVKRLMAAVEEAPNKRLLNADICAMGIDPARARRYFINSYGFTFQAYMRGRRLGKALESIRNGANLDDVVFDSGYESHSGFREGFSKEFGRPPGQSSDVECVKLAWIDTPIGSMVAGAVEAGICLLEFTDRGTARVKEPCVPGDSPYHGELKAELAEYFAGSRQTFSLPLVQIGTDFEKRVWAELLRIPAGEVRSYEEIAQSIGQPKAVRAVGTANGRNRISILIPCHRVVRKSGELGGYGGGLWRKRLLLDLERSGKTC